MENIGDRHVTTISQLGEEWPSNANGPGVGGYDLNNATGTNFTESTPRTIPEVAIISFILGLVILLTIGGNLLVCVTIATDKKLKNNTNYFILSLATTDLLLGCIVLPFSALNTVHSYWPLGAIFCNIYTSCDVMLCTVSILTLFAISLDRYFAVTTPLRYQQKMNGKVVWKCVAGIWVFSLLMAFLPIHLGWNTASGKIMNMDNPESCVFELNKAYVLLVSLGTYFGPLVIMCGVYLKVLQITREQVREINKLTKAGSSPAAAMLDEEHQLPDNNHNGNQTVVVANQRERNGVYVGHHKAKRHSTPKARQRENKLLSDTKATVTLASVILAFAICWVPYFVLFTAKPFLQGPINIHLDLVALWLGYVNSSINPFLYAFYNSSFREGFRKILCRRWYRRRMRINMNAMAVQLQVPKPARHGSGSDTSELSALRQSL